MKKETRFLIVVAVVLSIVGTSVYCLVSCDTSFRKMSHQWSLTELIHEREFDQIKAALDAEPHLVATDGPLLLYNAAMAGREDVVRHLVEMGADANARYGGRSPVLGAAKFDHIEIVRFLREKGAALDIHAAATLGDYEAVTAILAADSSVVTNTLSCLDSATPLHYAVLKSHTNVVELLLKHGADPNATSRFSDSLALHMAASMGDMGMVKLLIEHKADINKSNFVGRTPLHSAAASGHAKMVEFLLDNGLDIEARANSGHTPLHEAAGSGDEATVLLLLKRGADPNVRAQTTDRWKPWQYAEDFKHYKLAEILRERATAK